MYIDLTDIAEIRVMITLMSDTADRIIPDTFTQFYARTGGRAHERPRGEVIAECEAPTDVSSLTDDLLQHHYNLAAAQLWRDRHEVREHKTRDFMRFRFLHTISRQQAEIGGETRQACVDELATLIKAHYWRVRVRGPEYRDLEPSLTVFLFGRMDRTKIRTRRDDYGHPRAGEQPVQARYVGAIKNSALILEPP